MGRLTRRAVRLGLAGFAIASVVGAVPGNGEFVFEEFGESPGGLFELSPRNADTTLQGLKPMLEYDLLISDSPMEYPGTPST